MGCKQIKKNLGPTESKVEEKVTPQKIVRSLVAQI